MYDDFARYYDVLMDNVDYGAWARYLLDLMEVQLGPMDIHQPCRVLDAACGTGSLTIPLARRGCQVIGSDGSESMLRIAQEKARSAGRQVMFVRQTLQELALTRSVDCINCACDGVNYLVKNEDLYAFLQRAHDNLRPGGLLLFDVSSAYKLRQELDGRCYGEDRENLAYLWQNSYDPDRCVLQMDLTIFAREEGEQPFVRYRESHFQRAYEVPELVQALQQAGFMNVCVYGFLTQSAPGNTAQRIQFLARKNENGI